MTTSELTIDSGILQYAPKGAYYEGADEQFNQVSRMWSDFFNYDRTLFCLTTLLNGTGFSKGAMAHMLLQNPLPSSNLPAIPGLAFDYESKVILYNLAKERIPRALKNLLMLAGTEGFPRVNNSRTRKLIMEFIFNRDNRELDGLAINYKGKLKKLVRHALGKQDVFKIQNGDEKLFNKWIGKYNSNAMPIFLHLFDMRPVYKTPQAVVYFKKVEQYWRLRDAAQAKDITSFRKLMKGMPQRTVMGFRNTYQVDIPIAEIYERAKVSNREKIQMESAANRSGAKNFKVDYGKQQLYDLWKAFYIHLMTDHLNLDEIEKAIVAKSETQKKFDIGECVVVIDASKSMFGSDQRPLHPFLTALCLVATLDNVKDVVYIGGKVMKAPTQSKIHVLVPSNATPLWKGLANAVQTGVKNVVIISDGYENEVKGMFEHVYNHFKGMDDSLSVLHLNPVFAADAKRGTARKLAADVEPMPLTDHKFFETEIIFNRMIENREMVKKMLVQRYQNLIG